MGQEHTGRTAPSAGRVFRSVCPNRGEGLIFSAELSCSQFAAALVLLWSLFASKEANCRGLGSD